MTKTKKTLTVLFISTLAALTMACPDRTSIGDIERNPSKFNNKDVAIVGIVKDSYGVSLPGTPIRGGAYKIDDGSGSIWIITEGTVPNKGAEIGVEGTIGNGV